MARACFRRGLPPGTWLSLPGAGRQRRGEVDAAAAAGRAEDGAPADRGGRQRGPQRRGVWREPGGGVRGRWLRSVCGAIVGVV